MANFVFGWTEAPFDNYVVGFTLLALAGPLTFLSCFHLSNAFPYRSGLILSAITGAFDASSLPYTVYKEVYQNTRYKLSLKTFFWSYTSVGLAILLQQLFLGQDEPYDEEPSSQASDDSSQADERTRLLGSSREADTSRPTMKRGTSSGIRRSYKAKKQASQEDQQNAKKRPAERHAL